MENNNMSAEDYLNRAFKKLNSGDYEGAIDDFDKAIKLLKVLKEEIDPNTFEYKDLLEKLAIAYFFRGSAKSDLGKYKEAIEDYDKVIELNPDFAEAYLLRGSAKSNLGQYKESVKDYDNYVELKIKSIKKKQEKKVSVYKFKPLNQHTLYMLINKTIYLANPKDFNDPMDSPVLRKLTEENSSKNSSKNPLLNSYSKIRICSFTKKFDEKDDITNKLMWSHYSDSHKGIAIEYEITEDYYKKEKEHICHDKVEYKDAISVPSKDIAPKIEWIADNLWAFEKNKCWDYENEYRIVGIVDKTPHIKAPEIKSITFGLECPEEDIKTVREVVKKFYNQEDNKDDKIKFFKMEEDGKGNICKEDL